MKTINDIINAIWFYEAPEEVQSRIGVEVPDQTCPDIDKAVDAITAVMRICTRAGRGVYGTPEEIANEVESELWFTEDILEDLRKSNDNLRTLGREWHNAYVELHSQLRAIEAVADQMWRETSGDEVRDIVVLGMPGGEG